MSKDREWLQAALGSEGTVDILEWRRTAQSYGQAVIQNLATGRYNPKHRANVLLKQDIKDAPGHLVKAVQESLGAFSRAVLAMEDLIACIGTTLVGDARMKTKGLLSGALAADEALGAMTRAVEQLSDWKAGQVQAKAAKQRKSNFKIVQFCKALERMGTPATLAKYIVTSGWIEAPLGVDPATWPEFVASSMSTVSAASGEDGLEDAKVWSFEPLRFDLRGSLDEGAPLCRSVVFS